MEQKRGYELYVELEERKQRERERAREAEREKEVEREKRREREQLREAQLQKLARVRSPCYAPTHSSGTGVGYADA